MNHGTLVRAATAAVFTLAGAGTLRAQNVLDTTFAVRGQPRLAVSSSSGVIRVRPGSTGRIRVRAEFDRARIELDETSSRVTIRTLTRGRSADVNFEITVPQGTPLELTGTSTDIDVAGVCGELTVNTVSGDVAADCARGEATVNSVSGDVSISRVEGVVETSSTSGDVQVRLARGPVRMRSVSGDLTIEQVESSDIEATTVSGDVVYTGRITDSGRYRFEAHSGDLVVSIAGQLNATVTVWTFSGQFESDFPIELQPGTRVSREWNFRQGNGSARVRLQSFSGTVGLRRLSGSRED